MFGSDRIKMDHALLQRARTCAAAAGYASVEEFVAHVVERAVLQLEQSEGADELKRRLKGLGYLS